MAQDHTRPLDEKTPAVLPAGRSAPLDLPAGLHVWLVTGDRVEVYLQTPQYRTLLAVVDPGGHVFSPPEGIAGSFSVTGTPGAELERQIVSAGMPAPESADGQALVKSAQHWLRSLADRVTIAPPQDISVQRPRAGEALTGQAGKTASLLQSGSLIQAIGQINAALPERVAEMHAAADAGELGRITHRQADAGAATQGTAATAAIEAVAAAAAVLGVTVPGRVRAQRGDFSELPGLLNQAGLRSRKVALDDDWWQRDQGTLIVVDRTGGQALALAWHKAGYVSMAGERMTQRTAARIEPLAHAVYAPLPDTVTGLWSLARHLVPGVLRDGKWAVLAGAGLGLAGVTVPMATGWIFSDIVPARLPGLLMAVGLALVAAAVFSMLFSAARAMALSRISGRTGMDVAAAVADKILRLPAGFFKDFSAGDLNQRIEAIDQMRQLVTGVMISAAITLIFSLLYLVVLFAYDTRLALLALGLVSIYVAAIILTRALQLRHLKSAAELEGRIAGITYETLAGVAKLRVAAAEERALDRWLVHYASERRTKVRISRIGNHFSAFADAFQTITLLSLFAAAAVLSTRDLPAGLFIGFLVAFGSFQGAFTAFCNSLLSVFAAAPMAERARAILEATSETTVHRADPGDLVGDIEISGLTFGYGSGGTPVLNNVNLHVRRGEHLAIVGASGSGKSTMFRLLLGFEEPERGSITYDGQDLAKLNLSRVRSQIGVVMQASRLFAGSVYENIRGASDASLEACLEAAEQAGLANDLALLPMGLHTPLVEGAGTLSTGQKQRILIARALAGSPAILFLDEATSALDNATQAVVTDTLNRTGTTRITVAHRLSTVRDADRICVLEGGRIVENGTYAELMELDGAFTALARRQLTGSVD